MAQWRMFPSNVEKRAESQFSKGVNTGSGTFDIDDAQTIDEHGWDTDDNFPALSTSRAAAAYGDSGGAVTQLLTNFGTTELIRAVGTRVQKEVAGVWSDLATGFADAPWSAANFDVNGQALILTNGVDPVKYYNGTAISNLSSNAPKGKYVTADSLRVFIANAEGDETPDLVHYCGFQNAVDWTSAENSGVVQYWTPNGGAITALIAFAGQIWIYKKDSFALIYHTGDARLSYRLVPSSDNVGCVSSKTLCEVGSSLFWLGDNDVHIGEAGASMRIGEPVRRYLNRINKAHLDRCCAFTDGLRYYLNLVLDEATQPNIRLMYDTRYKIWRVSGINESYRYGALFNGEPYAGNASGQTFKINASASSGSWMVETKDYDRSEVEKEYHEMYLQSYLPPGSTVKVEVSVDQGETWYTMGDTLSGMTTAQNYPIMIPLDLVPLGYWARFRITGTGSFRLYGMQRFFRIQPLQY